jgi:hypothetical protein
MDINKKQWYFHWALTRIIDGPFRIMYMEAARLLRNFQLLKLQSNHYVHNNIYNVCC